ncbi:hypothetical protein KAR91_84630 [Candidatus Pacearchaeota archaeon]|nr:hypothetical protein [Candidatus Pacearchaeota archaeon]
MAGKKNTLEKKLQGERPDGNVSMETKLGEFTKRLWKEYVPIQGGGANRRAICMLGYLNSDNQGVRSPRKKIETVGELYSFSEEENFYGFSGFGKKTWMELNKALTKHGLPEVKLPGKYGITQGEKLDGKISMETNLGDFGEILRRQHQIAKGGDVALHRAVCMLGRLYDENESAGLVSRQIHTVGELYSFTEDELLKFSHYRKKTWLKLNEWMTKYKLPDLKLPQEYTADQ